MRHARIKAEGDGYYHGMSRIIERRMILGDVEKERLRKLMFDLAAFGGLSIMSYCIMTNHLHILVHVPQRVPISDDALLQRLRFIMTSQEVELIASYLQGQQKGLDPEGHPIRQGFTLEQIQAVVMAGGRLPMHELLRCRVRYFSDGLVLGSRSFADYVFDQYRTQFGSRRQSGARPLRFGDWLGLCSLRDLRLLPISKS